MKNKIKNYFKSIKGANIPKLLLTLNYSIICGAFIGWAYKASMAEQYVLSTKYFAAVMVCIAVLKLISVVDAERNHIKKLNKQTNKQFNELNKIVKEGGEIIDFWKREAALWEKTARELKQSNLSTDSLLKDKEKDTFFIH